MRTLACLLPCLAVACNHSALPAVPAPDEPPTAAPAITLRVNIAGKGVVRSASKEIDCGTRCSAPFDRNARVSLLAVGLPGNHFDRWSDACTGGFCDLSMDADKEVVAIFAADAHSLPPGKR